MTSIVYFIQAVVGGPIKIGRTTALLKRLAQLQEGCPFTLNVLCTMPGEAAAERALHVRFRADVIGGECFAPSADIIAFVESLGGVVFAARSWECGTDTRRPKAERTPHRRPNLGPKFSEGARQMWLKMKELGWSRAQTSAEIGAKSGTLHSILYGDVGVGRTMGVALEQKLGVAMHLWDLPPAVPFSPPALSAA
jgi:hypothetical protein